MSAIVVSVFNNLETPKDVTFQVTPEDAVSGLKALLRRRKGNTFEQLKKWNSTQLEKGVKFTADGSDPFEILLTAEVTANTFLTAANAFDPNPPANKAKKVILKNDEGVIERIWLYLPK